MRKYEEPNIAIVCFEDVDVITLSNGGTSQGAGKDFLSAPTSSESF